MRSSSLIPGHPEWTDWRWQMRHRLRSAEDLQSFIDPTDSEVQALDETSKVFRWTITPYYAALMDRYDPDCPIRQQVVPRMDELAPDIVGVVDPLDEVGHSPVKNLIHNYEDRVALCVNSECAVYCRYCLRKRMVGDSDFFLLRQELQEAIDYVRRTPGIRDVLLTGGDPLVFNERNLEWIISQTRAIPHIEIIRLGTRLPVTLPYRVTDELCEMLARYHPIWINTHFNHPREITSDAAAACDRLLRAGIPVGNQTVLLRGINDDVEILRELSNELLRIRVRPYYLYHAQLIGGTARFRTSIEHGMHLMEELRGRTSGMGVPDYVLDTPSGKIPLTRSYVLGRSQDHILLRTTRGGYWAEPNPLPANDRHPYMLPRIELPADVPTIPSGAPVFVYDSCSPAASYLADQPRR